MIDLVVRNGTLVTPRAQFRADIGVDGEKIVAIGSVSESAREEVDASGLYVLPGLIDAHVHFREPGLEDKEDFGTGSRAAIMGGVTTVLEMPNTLPTTHSAELVNQKRQLAEARSYCDFGLYGLLAQNSIDQLRGMAAAGVIGFKCFLGRSTGEILPPDDGRLLEGMRTASQLGLRVAFHAENDAIVQDSVGKLKAAGRTDPLAHVESRPVIAELESIQRAAAFAESTRAKIHVLHLSSAPGLAMVEAWRARGVDITCEVTPHHCFLSTDDMRRLGSVLRINPPVREPGHAAALLDALASDRVDMIATDHSPHQPAEKLNDDIWQAVSGFVGVETSLRLFLTHGVHAGRLTLNQLVRAMSEAPARTWSLYPRKGAIALGSDADLTLVDLAVEDVVDSRRLHSKHNVTPFEGQRTRGAAVASILRGLLVMQRGELTGAPRGRMLTP